MSIVMVQLFIPMAGRHLHSRLPPLSGLVRLDAAHTRNSPAPVMLTHDHPKKPRCCMHLTLRCFSGWSCVHCVFADGGETPNICTLGSAPVLSPAGAGSLSLGGVAFLAGARSCLPSRRALDAYGENGKALFHAGAFKWACRAGARHSAHVNGSVRTCLFFLPCGFFAFLPIRSLRVVMTCGERVMSGPKTRFKRL